MGLPVPIFHGSLAESYQLEAAVQHNCACAGGQGPAGCGAHRAILDQRFIDGVLFARYLADQLRHEEWASGQSRFRPGKARA